MAMSHLIADDEPLPVAVIGPDAPGRFLLIADHAGNLVPRALAQLGLQQAELDRHIGIDIGICGVAEGLARRLDTTLILQRYSRLVIDCNRHPDRVDAMPEVSDGTRVPGNAALNPVARAARVAAIFDPYHARIAVEIERRLTKGQPPVLIALHSFTPCHGDHPGPRPWHIGVLWNRDARLARAVVAALQKDDALIVGINEPYGVSDAIDHAIPVHAEARGLLHVELEIRQDLIADADGQARWAERLAQVLPQALDCAAQNANGGGMTDEHILFLGNQDLNGILRGRSVPAARHAVALAEGLPWVPANYTIGALNMLPPDNPFGPMGEIRFMPAPGAQVTLDAQGDGTPFTLALCDAVTMQGAPWPFCPRTALKDAVAALRAEAGLTMKVAFEHEFTVHGLNQPTHVAFSLSAGRVVAPLARQVLETLDSAGIALEQFQAEYGPGQFEISAIPTDPLTAADRTILTLETIRDTARGLGLRASFLPKPALDQVGNGVHIHFSLWEGDRNVTSAVEWLTTRSAPFVAGLIDQAESLIPLTVLSANSYARLRPQSWVGTYTCIGLRNREAMVRLVPRQIASDGNYPKASLEYRVTDATANVYIALAAIIRAGLAGIRARKASPPDVRRNPADMSDAEHAAQGLRLLPQSIDAALTPQAEADAAGWLGADLAGAYFSCRRNDARQAAELDFDDLARRLGHVY